MAAGEKLILAYKRSPPPVSPNPIENLHPLPPVAVDAYKMLPHPSHLRSPCLCRQVAANLWRATPARKVRSRSGRPRPAPAVFSVVPVPFQVLPRWGLCHAVLPPWSPRENNKGGSLFLPAAVPFRLDRTDVSFNSLFSKQQRGWAPPVNLSCSCSLCRSYMGTSGPPIPCPLMALENALFHSAVSYPHREPLGRCPPLSDHSSFLSHWVFFFLKKRQAFFAL